MSQMDQFPVLANELDINQVEDGYVIYQHKKGRVHYLNHTAALILELCTGENTAETIIQLVLETFNLEDSEKLDVEEGLVSLEREGIIQYDIQPGA